MSTLLCLVGMPAAGKSTISKLMADNFGANWIKTRDIIRVLSSAGKIDELQRAGVDLSSEAGAELFLNEICARVLDRHINIIDAIRPVSHWKRIKAFYPEAVLIAVLAPADERGRRFARRAQPHEHGTSISSRDMHPVEREIPVLTEMADYVISHRGSVDVQLNFLLLIAAAGVAPTFADYLKLTSLHPEMLHEILTQDFKGARLDVPSLFNTIREMNPCP